MTETIMWWESVSQQVSRMKCLALAQKCWLQQLCNQLMILHRKKIRKVVSIAWKQPKWHSMWRRCPVHMYTLFFFFFKCRFGLSPTHKPDLLENSLQGGLYIFRNSVWRVHVQTENRVFRLVASDGWTWLWARVISLLVCLACCWHASIVRLGFHMNGHF